MKEPKIRYYLEPKNNDVKFRNLKEIIMVEVSFGYAELDINGKRRNKPFRISLQKTVEPKKFGKSEMNFKFDANIFQKSQSNNATIRRSMQKLEDKIFVLYNKYNDNPVYPNSKIRLEVVGFKKPDSGNTPGAIPIFESIL